MRNPRREILISLVVLISSLDWASSESPQVPSVQCPVGVSIDAALYFKTVGWPDVDGVSSPASVDLTSKTEQEKREELESELEPLVGLTLSDLKGLSVPELVNIASLYYGLTKTQGDTATDTTTLGRLQLRELVEEKLEDEFSDLDLAREYLVWTFGSLSDQELILLSCRASFMLPSDLPFTVGQSPVCYDGSDASNTDAVTTYDSSATGGLSCRQKCRSEGFKVQLTKGGDENCYCCNSGLRGREDCSDTSHFKYSSAGLGLPLLSHHVLPQDYTDSYDSDLHSVKDSVFIQIGGVTYNVVLFEKQVVVFRLDGPESDRWEDSDDAPSISYVDNRKWNSKDEERVTFDNINGLKDLLTLHPDDERLILDTGSNYSRISLNKASSMTILPIFVEMDEQFYPDSPIPYIEDTSYDEFYEYVDIYEMENMENMAGRPHRGGKWFYHILIAHNSRKKRKPQDPPVMTMIRILDNGTMEHIMEYNEDKMYGRFKVPSLKKNVAQMLPLVRGRDSFFLTASLTPHARFLSPKSYSVLQAWKMVENVEIVPGTLALKTSVFEPVEHGETIQIYHNVKLSKIDFLYKIFIAVLDRTRQNGPHSRVRIFSFDSKDFKLNTDPIASQVFDNEIFTNLHSFVHEGTRYIVISKAGNSAKIFSVSPDGQLSQVGSDIATDSAGDLVDLRPIPTEFSGTTDLLEVKTVNDGGDYSTKVQVYSYDSEKRSWIKDPNQVLSSSQSNDSTTTFEVTNVPDKMRLVGSNVRSRGSGHVEFDLFVIPRLPSHQVDQRLRYETQIAVKIYDLDKKISRDDGRYLYNLHDEAKANFGLYLQPSGSVVTGDWSIHSIETGTVEAASVPLNTSVTLSLRNDQDEVTTLSDCRNVLGVSMAEVENKLNDLAVKVGQFPPLHADLLVLDAGETQSMTANLTVENLSVTGTLEYPRPNPFSVQFLASDSDSIAMADITNIFSFTQNNVDISATATFNRTAAFNGGMWSNKLASELSEDETVTVTTNNLLRLVDGQTITQYQIFDDGVSVLNDLEFGEGVGVTSADLPEQLHPADIFVKDLTGHFMLDEVVLNGFGLNAAKFDGLFPHNLHEDQLVPFDAESVNITGTIRFQSENFKTFGLSVGVVDGSESVNGKDILALYENAAWREAPESLDTINFDTTLTFPVVAEFSGKVHFEKGLSVTEINGYGFASYLQVDSLDNETIYIGGNKTLSQSSQFGEIFASDFNSLRLAQLVDKDSAQSVAASTFQAEVTVYDILTAADDGSLPSIDGVYLDELASHNIPGIIDGTVSGSTVNVKTDFSTIVISPSGSVTINDKINNIQLVDRVDNMVRLDEATVNITGHITFPQAVNVNDVKIKNVNTNYDTDSSSYTETFGFDDFVNTKNPQTIGSGKTFSGATTFADIFFMKADSKINDVKVAPLLDCWVDISSSDDLVFEKKATFSSLVADGLKVTSNTDSTDPAQLPLLNHMKIVTDVARLSEDNTFCLDSDPCTHTFSDFQSNFVTVGANLQTSSEVFGVSVQSLANQRVSLSSSQSLSGNYTFSQLLVRQKFDGEILYHYNGSDHSLADYSGTFLKRSENGDIIFTESDLKFRKLTASSSVTTGDSGVTGSVTVSGADYNVKTIYDDHFKYDDAINLSHDLTLTEELKVTQNIVVGGAVQGVDISELASDLVITGESVEIPVGGGVKTGYTISGTADTVTITGKKSFSVSPRVSGDIQVHVAEGSGALSPLIQTNTKEIQFSAGAAETRIMMRAGEDQSIAGPFKVEGDVEFKSGLATSGFGETTVTDIYNKYEYEDSSSKHILKTNFDFQGTLIVSEVSSDRVRGRNWAQFVDDTISLSDIDHQTISGDKLFSGQVDIINVGTDVETFNDIDLSTVYEDQVFIDEQAIFSSDNTFNYGQDDLVDFGPDTWLRAEDSLTLVDPEIETEDVTSQVFDVAFVYSKSVLIDDTDPVNVTGKLIFSSLTLLKDSTVGTLGKSENQLTTYIPEDLFLLNSSSLSFRVGDDIHQFVGANFNSDLKITGTIGGYSLTEFENVLYKSSAFGSPQKITGEKLFDKVTLASDLTSTGDINGLNLLNNLIFLDSDDKTLEGTYNFAEIELKNLNVIGKIDTVEWDDAKNHLFYAKANQNITGNFSFASPTTLTFYGPLNGDGDSSNGLGMINDLDVGSINGMGNTWKTVGSVKTAAQAEANVLCNHVKALANAYLANMKVSYYTYYDRTQMANADTFGNVVDMVTLTIGHSVIMAAISENKFRLLKRTKTDDGYGVADFPGDGLELVMMQVDGETPVENARNVEVVGNLIKDSEAGPMASSFLLVMTGQGALLIRISGSFGDDNIKISQIGGPMPSVVDIKFIPDMSTFFVAFQIPVEGKGYQMEVRSLPYPDYFFHSLMDCLDKENSTTADCLINEAWYYNGMSDLYLLWRGDTYTEKITDPHIDAYLDNNNNNVFLAVSNHFHTSTAAYVSTVKMTVALSRGIDSLVEIAGTQLLLPNPGSDDFVLLSSNNLGLLITGGDKVIVTKLNYDDKTFSEISRFSLPAGGPASHFRRHNNDLITVLEDNKNMIFLKYAGVNGVKMDGTLYLANHSSILTYTFFNPISDDKVSENLLLTANKNNKLYLYTSKANFNGKAMDIQCRSPEVGVGEKINQYCEISMNHTMCMFDKKSESCNITMNNIKELNNGFNIVLLDEHNRYRSMIARGSTVRTDLPTAGDMRKLSWEPELARLAEMWAAQCSSEHESVRKVFIDGKMTDYSQSLIAFKGINDWQVGNDSMKEMVRIWYNEVTSLDLDQIASYTYRSDTEHFALLSWSRTYQIGCGWTQYVDENDSHPFISLLVCNYREDETMDSKPIYHDGTACSNCGTGYTCEGDSGLCILSTWSPS